MKKKQSTFIIGVGLVVVLFLIAFNQFAILNIKTNYNTGDSFAVSMVAVVNENSQTIGGKNCNADWILEKRGVLYTYSLVKQGYTSMPNSCLGIYSCSSSSQPLFTIDAEGTYRFTAIYTCSQYNIDGGSWIYSNKQLKDDIYAFSATKPAGDNYVIHAYKACGDTTASSKDLYWYDSNGVRNDVVSYCSVDSPCIMTTSGPACAGTAGSVTELRCYDGNSWYYVNGVRDKINEYCTASEVCKSGMCVSNTGGIIPYGCNPGEIVDSGCDINGNYYENKCLSDGVSVKRTITLCGESKTCSTTKGCVSNIVVSDEKEQSDEPEQPAFLTNEQLCKAKGIGWMWDSDWSYCFETEYSTASDETKNNIIAANTKPTASVVAGTKTSCEPYEFVKDGECKISLKKILSTDGFKAYWADYKIVVIITIALIGLLLFLIIYYIYKNSNNSALGGL